MNKFIYPEEKEKLTNLQKMKKQKNEQVYWSWKVRKMNKCIDPEKTQKISLLLVKRQQGVTTVETKK